jgi:DMSO/TMAO reductase YedYZ molybdopterin-dependent catalytic subunit
MKKNGILIGGLLGGLTGLVLAALSELVGGLFGLPGIPFSLFDWMARHLPGPVITFFIGTMVKSIGALRLGPTAQVAKWIEQATAVVIFAVIGVAFGAALTAIARRRFTRLVTLGMWGGGIFLLLWMAFQISDGLAAGDVLPRLLWFGVLFIGWGWVLARWIGYLAWPAEGVAYDPSRRRFLYLVGAGSFTVLITAAGVSLASARKVGLPNTGVASPGATPGPESIANASTTMGPAKSPALAALVARFAPVPGTRPELTDNANFYRIDIDTLPPSLDAAQWRLDVKGLVDRPHAYTLNELRSKPSISQVVTLECISNPVGGDLTSTGLWTGVRLKDILAEVGLKPGVQAISMTAADGFYESVPIAEAMDERTLLVYQMNGQPLPAEHGFPLRIYIPNHFGMKQPKWLTGLEAVDHAGSGYWVDRGWNEKAIPPVTSVIDAIDANGYDPQTGLVPVGGIAYAGARGISKVEVQVDGGVWAPAELRDPPLSPLTWVQWRYLWKAQIGQHTFRVRAYDGAGMLQAETLAPPEPDGATGYHYQSAFLSEGQRKP